MPRVQESKMKELTREERRERRLLRREKQRKDNIGRAAKMHAARLRMERAGPGKSAGRLPECKKQNPPGRPGEKSAGFFDISIRFARRSRSRELLQH